MRGLPFLLRVDCCRKGQVFLTSTTSHSSTLCALSSRTDMPANALRSAVRACTCPRYH